MCAPATAALLLAALAALPCRGTDADTATRLNETQDSVSQPTVNKLYQMLHTLHNQTELYNFNYSNPISFYNLQRSMPIDNTQCCLGSTVNLNVSEGATVNGRRRLPRVVRRDDTSDSQGHDPSTLPWLSSVPPMLLERRRKPGETGSSAPLLNYIFDTYTNTHQHRNEKAGNGNSIYAAAAPEIEALVGSTAHLDCKVDALHDKLVSWVRRKNDEEPMDLLTTGTQLYTADDRYSARFIPPDIWRLEVKSVRPSDAAYYDCQLSAHPPRTARVTLRVPEVSVRIVDGAGAEVAEQVCEVGSTVALRCEVRGLRMEGGPSLLWYRREDLLNDDTTRGGISVRTEFGANGANSVLRVARVRGDDAGRYTCSIARAPSPAPPPAYVILHVIKGTDADTATRLNETQDSVSQPTVNKLYQMLHTLHNQTELYNFNYSNPISFYNLQRSMPIDNTQCCLGSTVNLNVSEGATVNGRRRLPRVVRRDDTSDSQGHDPSTLPWLSSVPPMLLERRRKPGETGSSAPLLNYIFDTYTNTHQHRNEKAGNGNSIYAAAAPEIEALVGSTAHLDCKVDALHDKLVSWVRRKNDEEPMDLLTTGTQLYTADDRYSARFIPPDIWRLEVKSVRPSDAAYYDCQLSAHPPRTARVTLRVPEVSVRIVDGAGAEVAEQVCEVGSTVALRCEVRGLRMEGGPSLLWYRREDLLNDDTTRGGISVRTEFGANGANSVLRVARVRGDDAGRYTCSIARAPSPAPPPAYVILHVIKGESLAELHQGGGSPYKSSHLWITVPALCAFLHALY